MVTLREKVAAPSRFDPGNTIGRNLSLTQLSCTIAPEIEIIRSKAHITVTINEKRKKLA